MAIKIWEEEELKIFDWFELLTKKTFWLFLSSLLLKYNSNNLAEKLTFREAAYNSSKGRFRKPEDPDITVERCKGGDPNSPTKTDPEKLKLREISNK